MLKRFSAARRQSLRLISSRRPTAVTRSSTSSWRKPVMPGSTISVAAPCGLAMTGVPQASA
jgi:hypothetical protein